MSSLEVDRSLGEVPWAQPGGAAGMAMLESFIDQRLRIFGTQRNDPNAEALSKLSPWFHSGESSGVHHLEVPSLGGVVINRYRHDCSGRSVIHTARPAGGAALGKEIFSICGIFYRGAAGAQRARRQLLLLQPTLRQHPG